MAAKLNGLRLSPEEWRTKGPLAALLNLAFSSQGLVRLNILNVYVYLYMYQNTVEL